MSAYTVFWEKVFWKSPGRNWMLEVLIIYRPRTTFTTVNLNGFLEGQKGILWQPAKYLLKYLIFTSSQIQSKSLEMKLLLIVFSNLISGLCRILRWTVKDSSWWYWSKLKVFIGQSMVGIWDLGVRVLYVGL